MFYLFVPTCHCVGTFYDFNLFKHMSENKISLTIALRGGTMLSKRDCLKEVKKPVLITRGKYAGKQAKDKQGNSMFTTELVPDASKMEHHEIRITDKNNKLSDVISYATRGFKPATQVLQISREAYDYYISSEVPEGYRFPKEFKANKTLLRKGISIASQAWNTQTDQQKLEWHLHRICESLGGKMSEYTIYKD